MKILIADDHAVVRQGIKQILTGDYPSAQYEEVGHAQEVLQRVHRRRWDLMILDLSMPGRGGLEILNEIKKVAPRLPVLVLSMHSEDQFGVRVLRAGASGYMTKESATEELLGAVRTILAGQRYMSPSLVEKMAAYIQRESQNPPHEQLSDREFQVLRLIAAGKPPTQIAKELSLSVKTISTYRHRILEKMHMSGNSELMYYAMQNRLV